MWKHVALLLATLTAFGVSLWMMQRVVGPGSPWMALIVFFCFLGLARVAGPSYTLEVPGSLRAIRPWELEGGLYRRLAVPEFGALLRDAPLRLLNATVYVSRHRRALPDLCRQVASAEAIHFWGAVLLAPYLLYCGWRGMWAILACFLVLQIVGNAYPIMHLRSVRGRLERVCARACGADGKPGGDGPDKDISSWDTGR
jgi:glycosyl-4,4'-diaponeurosporenoate acyltransferase